MKENIYQQHGFTNRTEYLENLADEHGAELDSVLAVADLLGESEDFDGLVSALQDDELNF